MPKDFTKQAALVEELKMLNPSERAAILSIITGPSLRPIKLSFEGRAICDRILLLSSARRRDVGGCLASLVSFDRTYNSADLKSFVQLADSPKRCQCGKPRSAHSVLLALCPAGKGATFVEAD